MWILWIHDLFLDLPPKTQNPFWIRKSGFGFSPQKHKCRYFYLSVHVVAELSSNIIRGNWGVRWWPKNALLWQITSNQNLVGMDQAVDIPYVTLFQFQMTRLIYGLSASMVLKRNHERVRTVHKCDCLHCTRISTYDQSRVDGRYQGA